jgi:hypothetical protein
MGLPPPQGYHQKGGGRRAEEWPPVAAGEAAHDFLVELVSSSTGPVETGGHFTGEGGRPGIHGLMAQQAVEDDLIHGGVEFRRRLQPILTQALHFPGIKNLPVKIAGQQGWMIRSIHGAVDSRVRMQVARAWRKR